MKHGVEICRNLYAPNISTLSLSLRVTPLATLIHFPAFCWNFAYYLILRGEKNLENGKWLEGDNEKKKNWREEVVAILSRLVILRCLG